MEFIRLDIQNLASLDREEGETINFKEGVIGESNIFSIVGPTGSGKSTILDAICLALYNRAPRYPRKKGDRKQDIEIYGEKDEDEKNRLAPTDPRNILTRGKRSGFSHLTFLANNGMCYRAEWSVTKKRKNFEEASTRLFKITTVNGNYHEEEAVWEDLPQIIGLDYDQFLRTVLIAQGSFASFVKAKEDERYELLEKLIGCEDLYTRIAAGVKEKRTEADNAYNILQSTFEVQAKNILSPEELSNLKAHIEELEAKEKEVKEELVKISEALAWYVTDEKMSANIAKFEASFNKARQELEDYREPARRLALHDATLDAVALFRERSAAERNVAKHESTLNALHQEITRREEEIKNEEQSLARLKTAAQEAAGILELQKPKISEARRLQVELNGLNKIFNEKKSAKEAAQIARDRALQALALNANAIQRAQQSLDEALKGLTELQKDINQKKTSLEQALRHAAENYETENAKRTDKDAAKLQNAKADAENLFHDLDEAIKIQQEISSKKEELKNNLEAAEIRSKNIEAISQQLPSLATEKLTTEMGALNTTLNTLTSESVEGLRATLVAGQPCPVCGSTHHAYHQTDIIDPLLAGLKERVGKLRAEIADLDAKREILTNEQMSNKASLEALLWHRNTLNNDIARLQERWEAVHRKHQSWPTTADELNAMFPAMQANVDTANRNLDEYNKLTRLIDEWRVKKDDADNTLKKFTDDSQKKLQEAEATKNNAQTSLAAEQAKTDNLNTQKTEKDAALETADKELDKALEDVKAKKECLKNVLADKDPDALEKELESRKKDADNSVAEKNEVLANLRQKLTEKTGTRDATRSQLAAEQEIRVQKGSLLEEWIANYNHDNGATITLADIAGLSASTDNWEVMRRTLKRLNEALTVTATTLDNERCARSAHCEKKPEKEKEELENRKTELNNLPQTELTESKAQLQRHIEAVEAQGALVERKQQAELLKREWDEIYSALGADGKTLRKIAQCYTLRFLVEHSNVEIRKFNSRYELQHVKNSLGLRVIDHDRADDVRDVTSLSGGETFIVSLGLALGLSALSSRNLSFGNLFIDEGFGTLDPDTLDSVIDALSVLQTSQGKKVCVISHTDTMSERIGTRICIKKRGNSGSSRLEIYP